MWYLPEGRIKWRWGPHVAPGPPGRMWPPGLQLPTPGLQVLSLHLKTIRVSKSGGWTVFPPVRIEWALPPIRIECGRALGPFYNDWRKGPAWHPSENWHWSVTQITEYTFKAFCNRPWEKQRTLRRSRLISTQSDIVCLCLGNSARFWSTWLCRLTFYFIILHFYYIIYFMHTILVTHQQIGQWCHHLIEKNI